VSSAGFRKADGPEALKRCHPEAGEWARRRVVKVRAIADTTKKELPYYTEVDGLLKVKETCLIPRRGGREEVRKAYAGESPQS
jgi:hypothetical protein